MHLPRKDRLVLTRVLLDLDRSGSNDDVEAAWELEIEARIRAFDEGCTDTIDYEDLRVEMTSRFS